ncbi:MAG: DUF1722 domain-containing protein, partial [Lachnospiraceae bacterium]|nr:DUF1722 domain-containing protein [Lachnospiraceae bacterium]
IDVIQFLEFVNNIQDREIDIMLEVKDKNVSALKCMLITSQKPYVSLVETEWGRYKYWLLEHSHSHYLKAREIIRYKESGYMTELLKTIQEGLLLPPTIGSKVNAGMHVWGYFKDRATDMEKRKYEKLIRGIQEEKQKVETLKKFLWKMTLKYEQNYLMESYYFIISGEE